MTTQAKASLTSKTRYFLFGTMVLVSAQALADSPYSQGFRYGHKAGVAYCNGIKSGRHGSQVEQFLQGCRDGFLDAVKGDRDCQYRLTTGNKWGEMMDVRRDTCS
jgi:hypothetical protein